MNSTIDIESNDNNIANAYVLIYRQPSENTKEFINENIIPEDFNVCIYNFYKNCAKKYN